MVAQLVQERVQRIAPRDTDRMSSVQALDAPVRADRAQEAPQAGAVRVEPGAAEVGELQVGGNGVSVRGGASADRLKLRLEFQGMSWRPGIGSGDGSSADGR